MRAGGLPDIRGHKRTGGRRLHNEKSIFADVWVDVLIVSLSLFITMYLQMRAYRKKEKELGEAIFVAEEANRAKSDFLAKMSHDIRTPLNTMMAMNEMIVANTSSARIRGWVNDSYKCLKIMRGRQSCRI